MRNVYDEREWRIYRWIYRRLTEKVDGQIGRILDGVKEAGLEDRTLIVFTSDHGQMDGSHRLAAKGLFFEESVTVPLVVPDVLDASDNCPNAFNPSQSDLDGLQGSGPDGTGDDCQCGDVNNDGVVNVAYLMRFHAWLVDKASGAGLVDTRCNVVGPSTPAPGCNVADIAVIQRFLDGAPVTVGNDCPAFRP